MPVVYHIEVVGCLGLKFPSFNQLKHVKCFLDLRDKNGTLQCVICQLKMKIELYDKLILCDFLSLSLVCTSFQELIFVSTDWCISCIVFFMVLFFLKPRNGRPRTQVQHLMQIDLKGWGVGYLSSFQQYCVRQMLNSVAGEFIFFYSFMRQFSYRLVTLFLLSSWLLLYTFLFLSIWQLKVEEWRLPHFGFFFSFVGEPDV